MLRRILSPRSLLSPAPSPAPEAAAPRAKKPRFAAPAEEVAWRFTTVALAVGSTAFAAKMIADVDRVPTFAGAEHLMIYARPSAVASLRKEEKRTTVATNEKKKIDYNPVGAIEQSPGIDKYKVVEANETSAVIRDPRGALVRISKGDFVAGMGKVHNIVRQQKSWTVITSRGIITSGTTAPAEAARPAGNGAPAASRPAAPAQKP